MNLPLLIIFKRGWIGILARRWKMESLAETAMWVCDKMMDNIPCLVIILLHWHPTICQEIQARNAEGFSRLFSGSLLHNPSAIRTERQDFLISLVNDYKDLPVEREANLFYMQKCFLLMYRICYYFDDKTAIHIFM